MPTEIRIVLPDTGTDDNLSTTTETDNNEANSNDTSKDKIGINIIKDKECDKEILNADFETNVGSNLIPTGAVKHLHNCVNVESCDRRSNSQQHPTRVVLQQTQHQLLDKDIAPGQGPSLIVREKDKGVHHSPPKMAIVSDESTHTSQASKVIVKS